jgi:thiol-disulfide isomerase/thioredoxin
MKRRGAVAALLMVLPLAAQQPSLVKPAVPKPSAEQQDLDRALSAAGASPVEYLRAIEAHLAKYPGTPRRAELEGAAARAAIEAGDNRATVEYGERVLARRPDDLQILAAVARALVAGDSRDGWQRALRYAARSETLLRQRLDDASHAASGAAAAAFEDQLSRDLAAALLSEARADGKLGRPADALALARRSFDAFPNAEAARETALQQEQLGHAAEAARALADAVTVPDQKATVEDRARDRARMGELWSQAKGSDAGLGDLVLEALDRNLGLAQARQMRLRAGEPNAGLSNPMQFTLGDLEGGKLNLARLKGKVVVLDFWATWCVPCREEHPLLEQVRARFAGNPDVVFLSIDTDENREPVKPFVEKAGWNRPVYYEDGLSRALAVMSLPTTIVFGRDGQVFSRLTGFMPGQFVDTLGQRITDALQAKP